MRGVILAVIAMGCITPFTMADTPPLRGLNDVNHAKVELTGGFWGPRLKTHREVTIPHVLNRLEAGGHVTNFDKAAGVHDGPLRGHNAFDSDLHKTLEGALYSMRHFKNPELQERVDNILDRILAAQQDDGYLISYYIVKKDLERWGEMRLEHQMYNAGHFFEMAVEHNRLTGRDIVLNAAKRFADHVDSIFGPGKRYDVGGHPEMELALVKLYRATGDRKYLDLSRFFLDERGHAHGTERKPFDPRTMPPYPPKVDHLPESERGRVLQRARWNRRDGRMQDHKPLIEQDAVGHAVCAGYVYSAMADIARYSDAPQYEEAVERIWKDVVSRKMYITGGLGTNQYEDEGFGDPYLLPNQTYCESCAAIAHVLWQHRMNLLKGHAKYADVMELTIYNGMLSGIAISGDTFFYRNPLESKGTGKGSERRNWGSLVCCPTNYARIIPQVGGLVYARDGNNLYVNLFMNGRATVTLDGGRTAELVQETNYPWDGNMKLTVTPSRTGEFTLCLRIPGWALGHPVPSDLYRFADPKHEPVAIRVNGQSSNAEPKADGYVHIKRSWRTGDVVELDLPMPVRRVLAHEKVEADRGKVALMRGPIVYCVEAIDHPGADVLAMALPRASPLKTAHHLDLLGGVTVIQGEALVGDERATRLTAVPYYAWANRERCTMTVWINQSP